LSQGEIPTQLNLSPDLRALGFTAAVSVLTGMLFGLAPAFLATRVDLNSTLKSDPAGLVSSLRSHRVPTSFGQAFVVFQVALSLLLLVGAGLFVRSLRNLQRVPAGFVGANALVMKLEPVGSDSERTPQFAARYSDLLRRVEAIPGGQAASLVGYSPMSRREWLVMGESPERIGWPISVQGYTPQPGEDMKIPNMQVYPNSFAALGVQLVAGRDFGPQDIRKWAPGMMCRAEADACPTRVAIINEGMARRFFKNENPIGHRFRFDVGGCPPETICGYEVIGVVKDVKDTSPRNEGRARFYLPFSQSDTPGAQMTLVVGTAGDPMRVAAAVQAEARALDPQMPRVEAETLAAQGGVFTGVLSRGSGEERITGTV